MEKVQLFTSAFQNILNDLFPFYYYPIIFISNLPAYFYNIPFTCRYPPQICRKQQVNTYKIEMCNPLQDIKRRLRHRVFIFRITPTGDDQFIGHLLLRAFFYEQKYRKPTWPFVNCGTLPGLHAVKKGKTAPIFEEPLEFIALDSLQADSLLNVKELQACIKLWMSLQPEKRGEIFRLKYVEDLTTREISEILGIAQKTVQNQLRTSFASLRDFLSKLMILLTLM